MDCEVIHHCILEFNVSVNSHLSLTTGPSCYTYFHQCLNGDPHDYWDVVTIGHTQIISHKNQIQTS